MFQSFLVDFLLILRTILVSLLSIIFNYLEMNDNSDLRHCVNYISCNVLFPNKEYVIKNIDCVSKFKINKSVPN
jgi:hypothetical protein